MKISKPICPDCARKELDTVKRIREYLKPRERRNTPIAHIAKELEISITYIEYLIKEKYFDVARYPSMMYGCRNCGAAITTGAYCINCINELQQEIQQAKETITTSDTSKAGNGEDGDDHFYRSRL
ncbi:hypothetical protein [Aneurinibacillus soli]|nr:hypothetical protein [Aneurinibacillus soli]